MTPPGVARLAGVEAIGAFLDPSHLSLAAKLTAFRNHHLTHDDPDSDDEARRQARAVARAMGEAGVFDPIARRDLRGLCLARESIAFSSPLADAVIAIQALAATPLIIAGTAEQQRQWLDPILDGRALGAFAMTEPGAGSDVAAIQTIARREGDDWILDGGKHLISNAGIADVYVVFAVTTPPAREGDRAGISALLVPADTTGLTCERQFMSAPHPLGRVCFDRCRVPGVALLGQCDGGFALGMKTLERIRPSVGAAACGMAARALTASLEHTATRQQFGQPLATFQVIRDRLGSMATELDAARLLVYRAAWQGDTHTTRISLEASMAKSFATEAAQHIVDAAVQMAGGQGVLLGHPVERLYRAVRALRIYEGTTEIQRLIVANELLGRAATEPRTPATIAPRDHEPGSRNLKPESPTHL